MTMIWFKIAALVFAVVALGVVFIYPDRQKIADKEVEAFRVCMSTIREEVLRDAGALKANLAICKEISRSF